jgi:uncharacterized protein YecE (DUF72 family)
LFIELICGKLTPMMCIGTSGFSYNDWVGVFYPTGLPQKDWLSFYAREFNACEINSTYYTIPAPEIIQAMVVKTGEGFLFSIKANQEMTHQRKDSASICRSFRAMLEPVIRAGKLGCILAQFPNSFDFNRENWQYLGNLRENLSGLPVVIEFRNARWLKVEVFQWMRQNDLGFCCVDEPPLPNLMPPVAEVTSKVGYVRFHGRNKEKWWQNDQPFERYDYTYKPDELREWIPKIKKISGITEKTFIFANNHWKGQSVTTVRQIQKMLE